MQLIRKFNNGFRFLLCAIDISSKYAWVIPLKDTKSTTITNALQKILDETKRKPKKVRVDKGSGFYNRSRKSWLLDHNIEMHSIHNIRKIYCCSKIY